MEGGAVRPDLRKERYAAYLAGFFLLAVLVYAPALRGPFVSDDFHYVANNPWVQEASAERLLEVLPPLGEASAAIENWAPLHLILHAGAVAAFGENVLGHHLLNLLLHALATTLLVALLWRAGVPSAGAFFGGLFFLLHPANVEAVAWISQLKTTSAFVLAALALLLFRRFPIASGWVFLLALLAKALALFALPVLAVQLFVHRNRSRSSLFGLAFWSIVLVAFSVAELTVFLHLNAETPATVADSLIGRTREGFAIVGRYALMATTTIGVSPFQEPSRWVGWRDPWWLFGLVTVAAVGARTGWALAKRREEAAWWVWAAAAYLPVSQLFPFRNPVADRYLYLILPGLLGGVLLAVTPWARRLVKRNSVAQPAAVALAVIAAVLLGVHSHSQARLWNHEVFLLSEAARHYPDGAGAWLLRAEHAVRSGERDAALQALQNANHRGFDRYDHLLQSVAFAPLRGDPRMRQLVHDIAGDWVRRLSARGDLYQGELLQLAAAHLARGEREAAREAVAKGLLRDGPFEAELAHVAQVLARGAR